MESIKKNLKGILIMFLASTCTSVGQLSWKLSKGCIGIELFLGFILYGIGALLIIRAFKHGSFSVLHPMLSISYIIATFLGVFILNEDIGIIKFLGIFIVIIGVMFVGVGDA